MRKKKKKNKNGLKFEEKMNFSTRSFCSFVDFLFTGL